MVAGEAEQSNTDTLRIVPDDYSNARRLANMSFDNVDCTNLVGLDRFRRMNLETPY